MKYTFAGIVISIFLIFPAFGQRYYSSYVHLDAGVTISMADVKRYDFAPTTHVNSEIRPGTGMELTIFTNENIGFNLDFHYYSISGVKPDWNLTYTGAATLTSLNLSFAFNEMFENQLRSPWNRRFKMFAKIGYGRFASNVTLSMIDEQGLSEWPGSEIHLGKGDEIAGALPLEVNVMYKLNKRHSQFFRSTKDRLFLVFSGSIVFVSSDLMDNYIDQSFSNDALMHYSIGVAYFFGK